MDLFRQMMKSEEQVSVNINDKNYLVTFLTTEKWFQYACSSPRNQGGAYESGYFMESCSETLILYRVEVVIADQVQKLPSSEAAAFLISRQRRSELLASCCAFHRSLSKGGNMVSTASIQVG